MAGQAVVVWARRDGEFDPWARVAGISLVERAARTANAIGPTRVVVFASREDETAARALASAPRLPPVEIVFEDAPMLVEETFVLALASVACPQSSYKAVASAEIPAGAAGVRAQACAPARISRDFLAELAATGPAALDALPAIDAPGWCERADTPAGRRAIVHHLFEACRKPVDGIVSRSLNRHVSIAISKLIVDTPISPNTVTIATFFLGVFGAYLCTRGTYASFLGGAACMQANSILDGVDGELARVRFQHSKLGQWLDTVADDLSNALYYVGITVGALSGPWAPWTTYSGGVAVGALTLTVVQVYAELLGLGSGDFYALGWSEPKAPTLANKIVGLLERVLKKDAFLFLYLVFAVFGVLPLALHVAAVGHLIAFGGASGRTLKRLFSGRSRA